MTYVSTVNRTIYINGRPFKLEVGKKVTKTQTRILDSIGHSSYYAPKSKTKRSHCKYTTEQRYFIAESYSCGYTRNEIVEGFINEFGSDHSEDSIGQKVEICKVMDNRLPQHTEFVSNDKELISMLQDIDPKRFGSSIEDKLDALLLTLV